MTSIEITSRLRRAVPVLLGLYGLGLGIQTHAADGPSGVAPTATAAAVIPANAPASATAVAASLPAASGPSTTDIHLPVAAPKASPFKIGLEDFIGTSNLPGQRRYSDGMWVGSSLASPSVGYVRYDNDRGSTARLSVGMGDLYTGSGSTVQQPVEAWWQQPVGKTSLTVGKYYVPFAQQEWEYESKPGAMLQWTRGADSWALSENYERTTRTSNTYLRVVHTFSPAAAVGVSLGAGKGLTFGSSFNRGYGLDGTFALKNWQLVGEVERMQDPSGQHFDFAFGKVTYGGLGAWKPFVGLYGWRDTTGTLGRYHSGVFGLGYQLTRNVVLEGGYAPTAKEAGRPASWLQLHTTWEK